MDMFAAAAQPVVLLMLGAVVALFLDRRPTDPGYTPKHLVRPAVRDGIDRALADSRRELRRHPAPWSQPRKRHSDETP